MADLGLEQLWLGSRNPTVFGAGVWSPTQQYLEYMALGLGKGWCSLALKLRVSASQGCDGEIGQRISSIGFGVEQRF